LKQGADVTAQERVYRNVLQATATGDHEAIARLLLERGMDVEEDEEEDEEKCGDSDQKEDEIEDEDKEDEDDNDEFEENEDKR